jgi:hypothetical protein
MRLRLLFTAAIALVIAAAPAPASAALQFEASLNGAQAGTPSPGTGTGAFTLNDAETQLSINVSFGGLVSPQTAAHIHGPAAPGVNAGVRFGFPLGSPVITVWNIAPGDVTSLKNGLLYVNVHSQTYPAGEIRGQIVASTPAKPATWGRVKSLYSGTR